ncbi:MAG: glycosyltransferase family 39 protein [Candidatus Omnitrophota bacterium]
MLLAQRNPIVFILLIAFILNVFGICWGLPYRLNPDEHVARTLRMLKEKTLNLYLEDKDKIGHPTCYSIFLGFFLLLWLGCLKIFGADLSGIISAASVSWITLARDYPWFANSVYVIARLLSAALGVLSIYLTFAIARRIFNRTVGLLAAAFLTLNMGFISTHHFAKNDALVITFSLLNLLFCVKALQQEQFLRNFFIAALITGLAISTKLDGAINLVPLFFTWLIVFLKTQRRRVFFLLKSLFALPVIALGVFLGWPSVFYAFGVYRYKVTQNTMIFGAPQTLLAFGQRLWGDARLIMSDFNVALFTLVLLGLLYLVIKWRRYPREFTPLKYMLLAYLGAGSWIYLFRATKFVVLAFPILSIIAAYAVAQGSSWMKRFRLLHIAAKMLFLCALLYSFAYCVRADLVFAKNDTRYASSNWIKNNIAAPSTLAIFAEPLNLFIDEITARYRVIEYPDYPGQTIDAQFLLHSSWEKMRFETGLKDYQTRPKVDAFFEDLLLGKRNDYALVKRFEYPEDLWWNPRPSYTCPVVYIFKRVQ